MEVVYGAVPVADSIFGTGFDGGCYIIFGEPGGPVEVVAMGKECSECRRQGAAGAVCVGCVAPQMYRHFTKISVTLGTLVFAMGSGRRFWRQNAGS